MLMSLTPPGLKVLFVFVGWSLRGSSVKSWRSWNSKGNRRSGLILFILDILNPIHSCIRNKLRRAFKMFFLFLSFNLLG